MTWVCDTCAEPIRDAKDGYVIWDWIEVSGQTANFRIIHSAPCTSRALGREDASAHLPTLLGPDGLSFLLSFLSYGTLMGPSSTDTKVPNLDEFVDFVRRVQTSYYEQARRRFQDADVVDTFAGSTQFAPYTTEMLRWTAGRPGD